MSNKHSKPCERCGETFNKPPKIGLVQWKGRRFCSRSCASVKRRYGDRRDISIKLDITHGDLEGKYSGRTGSSQRRKMLDKIPSPAEFEKKLYRNWNER